MVASCHPILALPGLLLTLCITLLSPPCLAQVGLRTLPLTAPRNKSLGLFSKWTPNGPRPSKRSNASTSSIENELAAIFRGVAYGVTTEATTSTTTTTPSTTTTPLFITRSPFLISRNEAPPSSVPVSPPPWDEKGEDARPVQHPHVEPPFLEYEDHDVPPDLSSPEEDSNVLRSDVGISKVAWIALLGTSWDIHVYTVAGLFTLLALCSLYCLARLHVTSQLLPRGYYITIHLLVFLASFFRCVLFFHDPYAVEERLPPGLSNVLFNTGVPCIITALAVLILALLRVARLRILPLNLQSPLAVAIISAILIIGSVIVDILGNFIEKPQLASGLSAGMQALTAGWGAALCLGYIVIFYKIEKTSRRLQNESARLSFSRAHQEGSLPRRFAKAALSYGARAALIAAISGLLLAVLQVYGLMNTEGMLKVPPQEPWVWFAFHTTCRSLEILMWACICFSSAMPASLSLNKRKQTGADDGQLLTVFSCKSCMSCSNLSTCCTSAEKKAADDLYSTICQSSHVVRKFSFQDGRKTIMQDTVATARPTPSQISTTLAHPKTRVLAGNSATIHANSDIQPLWTNYNLSSSSTSRPSSLILGENGAIRFRTVDPRHESVQIIDFKNKKQEPKGNSDKNGMNMFSGDFSEDNYINGGCRTPSDTCDVRPYGTEKYPQALNSQDSPELYAEIVQNQYCNSDVPFSNKPTEVYPPRQTVCRINNGSHVYEGYEVPNYYQCSDNASDSTPHIYASLQPIDRESYSNDLMVRRGASQGNFISNPHFRTPTSSPWRQANYADDQKSNNHRSDDRRAHQQQFCSESDLCSNDYVFNDDICSSRSVNFNPYPPNDLNSPHSVQGYHMGHPRDEVLRSFRAPQNESDDIPVDLLNNTPPPHQPKGLLSKIVPSNFNNGGYSPLSCEETSSLLSENARKIAVHSPSRNYPTGSRPKREKQCSTPTSPQKQKDENQFFFDAKSRRNGDAKDPTRLCNKKSKEPSSPTPDLHVIPNPFLHNPESNGGSRFETESAANRGPSPSSVMKCDIEVNASDDGSSRRNPETGWSTQRVDF